MANQASQKLNFWLMNNAHPPELSDYATRQLRVLRRAGRLAPARSVDEHRSSSAREQAVMLA